MGPGAVHRNKARQPFTARSARSLRAWSGWALLSTDLFWAHGVNTAGEVRADQREGDEVALHDHVLTAVREHLLKLAGEETVEGGGEGLSIIGWISEYILYIQRFPLCSRRRTLLLCGTFRGSTFLHH